MEVLVAGIALDVELRPIAAGREVVVLEREYQPVLWAAPRTARTEPGAAPVVAVRVAVVHSFGPLTQNFTGRVAVEP